MSLFPLISEPDTGELTGSDGLPLYREVDWDFRTNKPVWVCCFASMVRVFLILG